MKLMLYRLFCRNKLVIIDWKKSDKLKTTLDMMFDAPLQVAAYVGAVNFDKCFPYKVSNVLQYRRQVILM